MVDKVRYPLSTIKGDFIPLDVIRPAGVLRKDFLSSGGSTAATLPAGTELIMVRATEDCFIKFANSAATRPVTGAPSAVVEDTIFLQAREVQVISPPALFYSIIGDTANGTLTMQILDTWGSLALETQLQRG